MRYGLGIDTGGTYTDAVIYDFENGLIKATAKSVTIKEDLTIGINSTLDLLSQDMLKEVGLVSLSTTLATNACVEGKGSRAKLILLGCDADIVGKHGRECGLPDAREIIFLQGGHNQQGEAVSEPDVDYLKAELDKCMRNTDAFAVVELWGIKNPDFEKLIKEFITGYTGKLTICGHELTGEVNSLKRAASALLNAQLIPLINEFINAVKTSMKNKGISAPLVIVRGDGSLMSEEYARQKPVETMVSGPAASVAGGIFLTGEKDCIIIDMGGTTSDMALVENGRPDLTPEGANVGKWKTGIKSIALNTFGLGGDSLVRHTQEGRLKIGPVRVAPLSWLASRWPETLEKMRRLYESKKIHTVSLCEFFYLIKDVSADTFYSERELKVIRALKNGPRSMLELSESAGLSLYQNDTERLEKLGIIMRCGLTPTDIMHLTGDFNGWCREAAFYGASIMANQLNVSLEELSHKIYEEIKEKLHHNIVKMLLEKEDSHLLKKGMSKQLDELIKLSFEKSRNGGETGFIKCSFSTGAKLVGLGAPVHIFLPDVAKCFSTGYVVPVHAEVANAVGAITGSVVVEESITIRPRSVAVIGVTGYSCHASDIKKEFSDYGTALEWAKVQIEASVRKTAEDRGAEAVEVVLGINNNEAEINGGNRLFIETTVSARATGKIKWG